MVPKRRRKKQKYKKTKIAG